MRSWNLILILAFLALGCFPGDGLAGQEVSVLSVRRPSHGVPQASNSRLMAQPMARAGFSLNVCQQEELPKALATGKYNVLAWVPMYDMTMAADAEHFQKEFPAVQKAVDEFLNRGGGLLLLGPGDQQSLVATWALTERWGARMLSETVRDPAAKEVNFYVNWLYTDRISGPAAAGVRGIWYPSSGGKWWWPLEVDDRWTVVLRGAKTTTAQFETWSTEVDKGRRKIPVTDGVALAAVREVGRGRVAIMSLPSTYSFASPYNWPGADAVLYEGLNGKPSDGRTMMFNLIRWLAEPSQKAGLGGAKTPPELLRPIHHRMVRQAPVSWRADLPKPTKFYRGLIGARTVLSTGQSTVAEYARAARATKIDFMIFLEDHKAMTPAKNAKLKQECLAVSDARFQAIPGYTIEDEFGNSWFFAGSAATYPDDFYLSADRKILVGHYNRPERMNRVPETYRPKTSTLGVTLCNLTGLQHQYQVLTGSWNHRTASMPPLDFRDYNSAAIFTIDSAGKVIDDIWKDYFLIQNNGTRVEPYVMTVMDQADQVAERAKGFLTYTQDIGGLEKTARFVGSWRGDIACDQFISDGPQIVEWQCSNWSFPYLVCDTFRPDLMRNRVRLHVRSDSGLEEVCIDDGIRGRVRRFLPGGAKEFKQDFEMFNNPQQNLIVTVRDKAGRRALSKDLITKYTNFQEFMCGDRNNHIFNGFAPRADGGILYFGPPTGNGVTPDKGGAVWLMNPCYAYSYDEWSPCCPWDGGVLPVGTAMTLTPEVHTAGVRELPLHNTPRRVLHSQDVMIGEAVIDGSYPEEYRDQIGLVWYSIYPVAPTRFLEASMRLTYWRLKPDASAAVRFDETIRFKKDTVLAGDRPISVGRIGIGKDSEFDLRDSRGKRYRDYVRNLKMPLMVDLDGAGYVAFTNRTVNEGFHSLSKGLKCTVFPGGQVDLFLLPDNKAMKAASEFQVSLLAIGTPPSGKPDRDAATKAQVAFGIESGQSAYSAELEKGKIISHRFTLRMDGEGSGVSGKISKADLPAYLPVEVTNLKPNWTVVHYDQAAKQWRPVATSDGSAHLVLDPAAGGQSFFIGHPVVCDRPELTLQLAQTGEKQWTLEVHNPTDQEIPATIRFADEFPFLREKPRPVKVAGGQSQFFTFKSGGNI